MIQPLRADGDKRADADPDRCDVTKYAGLPQREANPENHNEVPDEIKMNESHRHPLGKDRARSTRRLFSCAHAERAAACHARRLPRISEEAGT